MSCWKLSFIWDAHWSDSSWWRLQVHDLSNSSTFFFNLEIIIFLRYVRMRHIRIFDIWSLICWKQWPKTLFQVRNAMGPKISANPTLDEQPGWADHLITKPWQFTLFGSAILSVVSNYYRWYNSVWVTNNINIWSARRQWTWVCLTVCLKVATEGKTIFLLPDLIILVYMVLIGVYISIVSLLSVNCCVQK